MNYINEKEFEINNIPSWHKQGYTGKGIRVANIEPCNLNPWYLKKPVIDPLGTGKESAENAHGNQTLNVISQVAPDADFYTLPRGGTYTSKKVTGRLIDETIPFIISEEIHLINASVGGTDNKILNSAILAAQEHGATFVCSAGNSGDRGASPYARSGVWLAVGAVVLNTRNEIKLTTYSSIDEHVDFVQFSEIYVNDIRRGYEDNFIHRSGTSFSSPLLCGMLALVQQFFLDRTGRTLNQEQLYQFVVDNSLDLGDVGKDAEYGHGLFILPSPEDIAINKYMGDIDTGDIEPEPEPEPEIDIGGSEPGFKDVDKDRWSATDIALMSRLGLMNGYPDGTFQPGKPVSREELATAFANFIRTFSLTK